MGDDVIVSEARNRSCGDVVRIGFRWQDDILVAVGHEAEGCLLCRASASIACQVLEGLSLEALTEVKETAFSLCDHRRKESASDVIIEMQKRLTSMDIDQGLISTKSLKDFEALAEVRKFPTRSRCMTLAWECVKASGLPTN